MSSLSTALLWIKTRSHSSLSLDGIVIFEPSPVAPTKWRTPGPVISLPSYDHKRGSNYIILHFWCQIYLHQYNNTLMRFDVLWFFKFKIAVATPVCCISWNFLLSKIRFFALFRYIVCLPECSGSYFFRACTWINYCSVKFAMI